MTERFAPARSPLETALPKAVAQRMLALIEAVGEYDGRAAAHSLTGLLRLAAGEPPTLAESTSLQIAGLATIEDGHLALTPEGGEVLARETTHRSQPPLPPAAPEPVVTAGDESPAPLARLRIGPASYEIASYAGSDVLAFRTDADMAWRDLEADLSLGWFEIAAEILQRTRNALEEYVRMHMIRRREDACTDGQNGFDLYGLGWEVRETGTALLLRLDGDADWREVRPSALAHVTGMRERAAAALVAEVGDLRDRIGEDVHAWARRLAAGAMVEPL
ncbi:hypothetical protein LAZ29_18680 [Cereibacter sphaeroides]|uniref:hypothetical protein n=1 Tax=Cereibacter sphaeroides TaxID=1063 RepID=UPI001F28E2C4|nr:hypothetical protein [Cereibacter sphaeroides]MCE6952955.1 hypothetical protein [Cereibacter sphaeroides]